MGPVVHRLDLGSLTLLQPQETWQEGEVGVATPVSGLLILNAGLRIVVDTGFDPGWMQRNCRDVRAAQLPDQQIVNQLALHSVRAEEIDLVINTHLHVDHCGGNRYFPGSKWIISRTELRHMYVPDPVERLQYEPLFASRTGGLHEWPDLRAGALQEIVPGLAILGTPGHSAGHLSVLISGSEPPLLYSGDLGIGPVLDAAAAQSSAAMADQLARDYGANLVGCHDPVPVPQGAAAEAVS